MFAALEHLEGAKGRLERVGSVHEAPIFVDYAHKPDALEKALGMVDKGHGDADKAARACRDHVVPAMAACRTVGDALELMVDDALWPLPKYREMLWLY